MRLPSFLACLYLSVSFANLSAQDAEEKGAAPSDAATAKPKVERISETEFKIGKVTLNTESKEISFPGKINMTEGLLEYLIVMPHGKMHESLLITETDPFNINIALKLLSIPSIPSYFPELDENFTPIPAPPIAEEKLAASRLKIIVSWKKDGKTVSHALSDLVKNNQDSQPITASRWLYTGSVVEHGDFAATLTGDILAILNSRASLINYNGPGNENDEIWIPVSDQIPAIGTDLTITLKPAAPAAKK